MLDIASVPLVVDEATLDRARRGDREAFADIVREHQAMVFSIAFHFVRDRSVAEDLAQDVFLQLFRELPSLSSPDHITCGRSTRDLIAAVDRACAFEIIIDQRESIGSSTP